MAGAEVSHGEVAQQEQEIPPGRRAVHRPVEGLTMQELLRSAAKTSGNSAWAETLQPLSTFENSIASRISSQAQENRDGNSQGYNQAQRGGWVRDTENYRDRPPRPWPEALPPTSEPYSYFTPVSALAALGSPAAKNLARIIEASQQEQYPPDQSGARTSQAPASRQQTGTLQSPPHQLFLEQPNLPPQSWEVAQQLQMGGYGPYPPQGMEAPRWGGARGPKPQARAFDVYQPPPQLSEAAQTELFRSLQMLQEAQRLSALASSQIQDAYESAGQGSNIRKRKLAEASNALTQQIGEVLAEGQEFTEKPATQVCSLCGITQTPVWRRLNKALVCNACGLKRRRSANTGRQASKKTEEAAPVMPSPITLPVTIPLSMPLSMTNAVENLSVPKPEPSQQIEQEQLKLEVS